MNQTDAAPLEVVYKKAALLSDDDLRQVITWMDEKARQTPLDTGRQAEQKRTAYQAMLERKKELKYPDYIDEKKIKEEAFMKQYGCSD